MIFTVNILTGSVQWFGGSALYGNHTTGSLIPNCAIHKPFVEASVLCTTTRPDKNHLWTHHGNNIKCFYISYGQETEFHWAGEMTSHSEQESYCIILVCVIGYQKTVYEKLTFQKHLLNHLRGTCLQINALPLMLIQTHINLSRCDISLFFWFTGVLCSIKQSKTKTDFKWSLIHYLDHVWLLDPVIPHTRSSASPFTPASPDRQAFLFNRVS